MRYIIIGISAAAVGTINKLRQLDASAQILVFSDEKELPYNKCFLADYVAGQKEEQSVFTLSPALWEIKKLTVHLGTRITHIDSVKKTVTTEFGLVYHYDKLCIATGSSPITPRLPGVDCQGVYTFHSLADSNSLLSSFAKYGSPRIVIVGAGLTGLECADALYKRGAQVTVVEMREQVLAHFITPQAATIIQDKMAECGVSFINNQQVVSLIHNDGQATGILLSSGKIIEADAVVFTIGVRPNSSLAVDAGLQLDGKGIAVNEYMQTSNEHIFAAGDVITITELLSKNKMHSCTWPDAMMQGIIAAHGMLGIKKPYPGAALILSSAFFGLKVAVSYGANSIQADQELNEATEQRYLHLKIINGALKSFMIVGQTSCMPILKRMILLGEPFDKGKVID